MKVLTHLVFTSAAGVLFALQTAQATGTIDDVELKAPLKGGSSITAQVLGLMPDTCREVAKVWYEKGSFVTLDPNINIFVKTEYKNEFCNEVTVPFSENVQLGHLRSGTYTLNVFKDDQLSLSKQISIPDDVRWMRFGLDRDRKFNEREVSSGNDK